MPANRRIGRPAGASECSASPRSNPGHGRDDHAGERQMGRQTVLADRHALGQAGRHHPPADGALQSAERQEPDQARLQPCFETAGDPEEGKRQGDEKAHPARQHPVRPLPPEDAFELRQRHAFVDLLVLRDLPVLLELLLPFCLVERRYDAVDRLPLRDGQAGAGHARRAADHHKREENDQNAIKPAAHQRPVAQQPVALGERGMNVGDHGHWRKVRHEFNGDW